MVFVCFPPLVCWDLRKSFRARTQNLLILALSYLSCRLEQLYCTSPVYKCLITQAVGCLVCKIWPVPDAVLPVLFGPSWKAFFRRMGRLDSTGAGAALCYEKSLAIFCSLEAMSWVGLFSPSGDQKRNWVGNVWTSSWSEQDYSILHVEMSFSDFWCSRSPSSLRFWQALQILNICRPCVKGLCIKKRRRKSLSVGLRSAWFLDTNGQVCRAKVRSKNLLILKQHCLSDFLQDLLSNIDQDIQRT